MSRKFFWAISLLIVASMMLAACAPAATPAAPEVVKETVKETVVVEVPSEPETVVVTATPEPAAPVEKPAVLRINLGTYPDVIDPQKSSFVNEIAHLKLIYEGLTTFNEKLETVPGAAEKWEYNADATVLTFTLKKDLKYSDGSLLNAKRFEYSIRRNIDPATAGEYASITDEILGAPDWRAADTGAADYDPAKFIEALGVKALDSTGAACADYEQADCLTLQVTLSKPAPYFHTILGIWVAYPAKEENISEGGVNWWNSSKYQVGNGPFILKTLEPFVRALFVPNPSFEQGVAKYDLEYSYITDSAVAFEAYKNNELDVVPSAAEDLEAINADADLKAQHLTYAGSCTTVIKLGLGGTSPFKDDIELRKAFAYGFDAEGWANDVDGGLSLPTWTWIPPGYPGYEASDLLKFDPEKAKAALAASKLGSAEAFNKLGIKLTFGQSARNLARSEWLVNNYKEVLGVDIALDPVDPTTFTAITKDPATFPLLARQGWCADYPDPQNWLSVYWRSDTTFAARQGYANTAFDELTRKADVELDPAKRLDLYLQAQRLLLEDVPSAFGYNSLNHYLVKPWVKGLLTTPQDSGWPGEQAPLSITIDTSLIP